MPFPGQGPPAAPGPGPGFLPSDFGATSATSAPTAIPLQEQWGNDAITTLAQPLLASGVELFLATAGDLGPPFQFPATGNFAVRIGTEIIEVGARDGLHCANLTRGAEGTIAADHPAGSAVEQVVTAAFVSRVKADAFNQGGQGVAVYIPRFTWAGAVQIPGWSYAQAPAGVATQDIVFRAQAPSGAGTTLGNAGGFRFDVPGPVGGGNQGYLKFSRTDVVDFALGFLVGSNIGIWCGSNAQAPTSTNYTLQGGATLCAFNAPGTNGVLRVGGTTVANWTAQGLAVTAGTSPVSTGTNLLQFSDSSTAPGTPSGGGCIQSVSGAGKWYGSSGTITTFGPAEPHCPVCGRDYMVEYENPRFGYFAMCLPCHAEELEVLFGGPRPYVLRTKPATRQEVVVCQW